MNHSAIPIDNETIRKLLQQQREALGLGATGRFPEGQLDDHDEGEINFAVSSYQGKVILDFGKAVHWLGMDPAQARLLARSLMSHATNAEKERGGRRRR